MDVSSENQETYGKLEVFIMKLEAHNLFTLAMMGVGGFPEFLISQYAPGASGEDHIYSNKALIKV